MLLTHLRRSASRKGGWLVNGKPKREARQIFNTLPAAHCRFLAAHDIWWLDDDALEQIAPQCGNWNAMSRAAGYNPRQKASPPPNEPSHDSPYAAMYLRDNAPNEVVDAVYRALAKLVHPDIIGPQGHERMQRLNLAYEAIKKLRKR